MYMVPNAPKMQLLYHKVRTKIMLKTSTIAPVVKARLDSADLCHSNINILFMNMFSCIHGQFN